MVSIFQGKAEKVSKMSCVTECLVILPGLHDQATHTPATPMGYHMPRVSSQTFVTDGRQTHLGSKSGAKIALQFYGIFNWNEKMAM